jgi:hypothetical protein
VINRDVVIHTNHNIFPLPNPDLEASPPVAERFDLSDDLWIGSIESEPARIVLDLGEPNYFGTPKPVKQYAQLYSFVRETQGPGIAYRWDEDSRLQSCVALSRLIQPTSVSLRYTARIRYNSDSTIADISPGDIRGVGIDAYLARPQVRDWLTEADAVRLHKILKRLASSRLPDRASRALWYHEYAVRTYYVEIRWVLVATALEAIVHVEQYHSTRQFKVRVSQLASELGVTGLGINESERAYTHRSTLAHGQKLGQLSEPDRQLYEAMETTLRLAILRAIEDDAFAAILNDAGEIQKQWPL